jgi:hypothetical protein
MLMVSVIWFALTLQHRPISFLYIVAWIGIGFLYSLVMVFGVGNRHSAFWDVVSFVILVGGGFFISDVLFLGRGGSDWFGFSQGVSIVFVFFFVLNWALRRKLMSPVHRDVEQIVEPGRGTRGFVNRLIDSKVECNRRARL